MGKIVLLDDLTINKIAAGEVIERPASVVKEMVENSIDAGAKNIGVEIKNGGISYIKITDDGCGISEDDMEIAFERHATSKIRSANDLSTVMTMGFRGEALASIAAIANVEMISKKDGEEIGHRIVVEGGKILEANEVGCPVGTTIIVRNLFFNTPVRYKFLKKDFTEAGFIEDTLKRIALANKNIAIKLISSGKTVVSTNGSGDFKNIVYSIYGKEIANGIMEVDTELDGIRVTGVVGKPEIARANRQNQMFFVNGRYIKDKNLTAAVDQSYKGIVPIGKYGFVILKVELSPDKLDVNVHPAKLEVRFQDENAVFKAVYHAIKTGLSSGELVANIENPINIDNKPRVAIEGKMNLKLSEEDEKEKQDMKDGLSIDERIQKINSIINQISFSGNSKSSDIEVNEDKQDYDPNNVIEQIYNSRNKITSTGSNTIKTSNTLNVSNVENYFEEERAIKFGDTQITSDTQEISIAKINEKLRENKKISELEDARKEATNILNEIEEEENSRENIPEEKNDAFYSAVTEKIIESKLSDEDTEMVDTEKIQDAVKNLTSEFTPEFENMYKKAFGIDLEENRRNAEISKKEDKIGKMEFANAENQSLFGSLSNNEMVKYKFIGVAFSTYIIIEIGENLYMIDQHAAHERIMYEKIRANYYSNEDRESQLLLIPDIITLTNREIDIAFENREMFYKAGFEFEEFGENTIKLTSAPSMCEDLNTKKLFIELLDEIDTVALTATQEKEDKFIATVACKAAVKGNMKLDEMEIESLMQQLLNLPNPFSCPHGRPTAIKMTKYDVERKFSRK